MKTPLKSSRIVTLDLMRGYFILIIIVDHMIRWPSVFAWITGQGRLWVSAAEGFFIISGLLIGYTRGFKKRELAFKKLVLLLYTRAAVLYLSAVLVTIILYFIASRLTYSPALQPALPPDGTSLLEIMRQIITQKYVFEWVYFLKLYWAALLLSPIFMLLFRKQKFLYAGILSLLLWLLGIVVDYDWLQWQALLFIPAIAGYNLENIRGWWQKLGESKRGMIRRGIIVSGITSLMLSSFWVFGWRIVENPKIISVAFDSYVGTRTWLDPIFAKSPLSPARVLLAFIWFAALFFIIRINEETVKKWFGWLLMTLGERSLSVYVLHGFILVFIQSIFPISGSLINAVVTAVVVSVVLLLLQIPFLRRILPR